MVSLRLQSINFLFLFPSVSYAMRIIWALQFCPANNLFLHLELPRKEGAEEKDHVPPSLEISTQAVIAHILGV